MVTMVRSMGLALIIRGIMASLATTLVALVSTMVSPVTM